jgi:hypothetical protein
LGDHLLLLPHCLHASRGYRFPFVAPRSKVPAMNIWLTVRTFIALFLVALGIGLMFVRSEDMRLMVGALFVAMGLTFMLRMALVLRQR